MSLQVVYGTHSPELPEASPRNGGTGPVNSMKNPVGGASGKLSLEKGKKQTCLNKLRLGMEIIHVFLFFLLNHVSLFVREMGILLVFSITDKDFREPLIQMMLYDWVVTGVASENWHCSFIFKCLRYILSLD